MSQETRKDPRGKDVNLVVRYKSATVDEFIEQHAVDVSRGGVFVKSDAPSGPGTLLKFELRIADDKAVIAGVGRVVWKRDRAAGPERPSGMGVKFIKIDDASRSLIEDLVGRKSGAGANYEAEAPGMAPKPPVPGRAPAAATTKAVATGAPMAPRVPSAKQTIAGMPATMPPPPAEPDGKGSDVKASGAPNHVTLSVDSLLAEIESDGRMGQALNTALVAMGASLPAENRGTFATRKSTVMGIGHSAPPPAVSSNAPAAGVPTAPPPPPDESGEHNEPTVMRQAAELLQEALREAGGNAELLGAEFGLSTKPQTDEVETRVHSSNVSPAPKVESDIAFAKTQLGPSEVAKPIAVTAKKAASVPAPAPKKSNAATIVLVLLLLVVGGAAAAWKMGLLDPYLGATPPPVSVPVVSTPAVTAAASAAPAPSAVPTVTATASASSSAMPGVDAGALPGASASTKATTAVSAVVPVVRPVAPVYKAPAPKAPASVEPGAAPAPATAAPAPAPAPSPAPAPAAPGDMNLH